MVQEIFRVISLPECTVAQVYDELYKDETFECRFHGHKNEEVLSTYLVVRVVVRFHGQGMDSILIE